VQRRGRDSDSQPHLPQLRRLVELAEEIRRDTAGADDVHTHARVHGVGGLTALEQAVIAKVSTVGDGGHSGYTEALIDRNGEVRVGYERDSD
jgi:hypothetical protein